LPTNSINKNFESTTTNHFSIQPNSKGCIEKTVTTDGKNKQHNDNQPITTNCKIERYFSTVTMENLIKTAVKIVIPNNGQT
jgi:hypothetical protein